MPHLPFVLLVGVLATTTATPEAPAADSEIESAELNLSSAMQHSVADSEQVSVLASPDQSPMDLTIADDPLAQYLAARDSSEAFASEINRILIENPTVDEAIAGLDGASAARREARSGLFPTLDLQIGTRESFARNFSNDPDNILERSRSSGRTDATFVLQQRILDFGATSIRIDAAGNRIRAAEFEIERQAEQIALRAIAARYDVFTFRALIQLGEFFAESQEELKSAIQTRIDLGLSADGDMALVQGRISANEARLASFHRQLANAEARYLELFGSPAPNEIHRVPPNYGRFASVDAVRSAALQSPAVDLVQSQARAARQDARAARADTLPNLSARLEGGRFGIFENDNDYDVRGSLSLTHQFFGPGDARADQAESRADASQSRAEAVSDEASRLAAIAWSDVRALESQLSAIEQSYISNRQSRDVIAERFLSTRGTLFQVLDSENNFFDAATRYVQAVAELDAARYILLSRTGRLLDFLGIDALALARMRAGGR